jgi:SAM-dependent methyltransferase
MTTPDLPRGTTTQPDPRRAADAPRICDYEGSPYRVAFWEDADRDYEDAAERLVLKGLLPPTGRRLVEIGAGFGRLIDLYAGYDEVYLLDYAESMLRDARDRLGDRATYVCADLYNLPFASGALDTVVQVRVLHHVEDVDAAFDEVHRVLRTGGSYVLEFANKRHAKAAVRYALGKQTEDPFSRQAHEFVPLNWNFHPDEIEAQLERSGLLVRERRAASHFRVAGVKARVPAPALARLDAVLARPLGRLALGPSQFVRASRLEGPPHGPALFRCPACGHEPLPVDGDRAGCPSCGRPWERRDGIWRFRLDA